MRKTLWKGIYPVLLGVMMLADAQISNVLRIATKNEVFLNSHLFLIGLILGCFYYSRRYMMSIAIVLGLIFDMYYYGILGINTVSFPLTVMLIYFVFTYIKPSISMIFISLVIFITIMDSSIYIIQLIFNLIQSNTQAFIVRQLGPTMLLNMVFFILLAYPIQKMIKNRDYL